MSSFANMNANFAAMNAFMNHNLSEMTNTAGIKPYKKESHKKKKHSGKRRHQEDESMY